MNLFVAVFTVLCSQGLAAVDQFYTAAVFEHARFGSSNDSAATIIEKNLDFYKRAAKIAKCKGADVIVFPEYGIFSPGTRVELKNYLESTPNPKIIHTNPCNEEEAYSSRPILLALSCLANSTSMVVVANTGDIQNCEGQPDCPPDGVFHFNTNVVFDRDGTLLVRYHKEHLFYEDGMDLAREEQNSTFVTDFGTFATYICFDIMFERISRVARWPDVDGIMFSTMWLDLQPQMTSVQFWQSFALGNNVTFLASNIQIPGYYAIGSGIFHGELGALGYTFNPDGLSKLVVSTVPKPGSQGVFPNTSITAISNGRSWNWKHDGRNVPEVCSEKLLNSSVNIFKDYRCLEENATVNYTFKKLVAPSGHMEACHNGMCCTLDYTAYNLTENFYLGVYNGTYDSFGRYSWCEENCVLVRCEGYRGKECATFPLRSHSLFQRVHLSGNFSTDFVFPSVVASAMRLVPRKEWSHGLDADDSGSYDGSVHFESESGRNLIAVGLKGRCYDRDAPYVR